MADDNFRSFRRSNPVPLPGAKAPSPSPVDDPLAELARLIGQNDPVIDEPRAPTRDYAPQSGGADWVADDRYVQQGDIDQQTYDERYDDRYDQRRERRLDPYPPLPALPDRAYAPPREATADQFAPPAPRPNASRDASRGHAMTTQPQYADEQELPAFLPRPRDNRYQYDDEEQAAPDDQYAMEDDDEDEAPRRRGGFVVIAAVLGLAVLGTAGAFAYRAMFGGSMLPSLPPIIKAEDGPVKVVPSNPNAQGSASSQMDPGNSGGDKLVPRQEAPMSVPQPANVSPAPASHAVATVPIFPDQTPGPPSGLPANAPPSSAAPFPVPAAPSANVQPPAPLATIAQQQTPGAPMPIANPETSAAASMPSMPGAKKIHTVAIHPDQMAGNDTSAAAPAPTAATPAQALPAAPARPVVQQPHVPKPAPLASGSAPLSIVPSPGGEPAPLPTHPAAVRPTTVATASASAAASGGGGGYAVQVSSQRSEADAEAAYRALQAKYPSQLGGRQPMVRRADLGDKGIYYRALVGPFASMEQAAAVCSSLKAAGGTCIVQKD